MEMKITPTRGFPPNWREIVRVFPMTRHLPMIVAYGDKIFITKPVMMTKALLDHERVHCERQTQHIGLVRASNGVAAWWDDYLADPLFRLAEEVLAHRAEYATLCEMSVPDRFPVHLDEIARKLSHKVYGPMIDFETAKREIAP